MFTDRAAACTGVARRPGGAGTWQQWLQCFIFPRSAFGLQIRALSCRQAVAASPQLAQLHTQVPGTLAEVRNFIFVTRPALVTRGADQGWQVPLPLGKVQGQRPLRTVIIHGKRQGTPCPLTPLPLDQRHDVLYMPAVLRHTQLTQGSRFCPFCNSGVLCCRQREKQTGLHDGGLNVEFMKWKYSACWRDCRVETETCRQNQNHLKHVLC